VPSSPGSAVVSDAAVRPARVVVDVPDPREPALPGEQVAQPARRRVRGQRDHVPLVDGRALRREVGAVTGGGAVVDHDRLRGDPAGVDLAPGPAVGRVLVVPGREVLVAAAGLGDARGGEVVRDLAGVRVEQDLVRVEPVAALVHVRAEPGGRPAADPGVVGDESRPPHPVGVEGAVAGAREAGPPDAVLTAGRVELGGRVLAGLGGVDLQDDAQGVGRVDREGRAVVGRVGAEREVGGRPRVGVDGGGAGARGLVIRHGLGLLGGLGGGLVRGGASRRRGGHGHDDGLGCVSRFGHVGGLGGISSLRGRRDVRDIAPPLRHPRADLGPLRRRVDRERTTGQSRPQPLDGPDLPRGDDREHPRAGGDGSGDQRLADPAGRSLVSCHAPL
jgi:hypothetical protein